MVNTKKYEVTLANDSTIFDSAEFDTFEEALEWSTGRGKNYKVNILRGNTSWDFVFDVTSFMAYNPFIGEWYYIKKEDIKKECGIVLDPEYL